jgi:glutathionyl-hydroquinone reductase
MTDTMTLTPDSHLAALGIGGSPHPLGAQIEASSKLVDQAAYEQAFRVIFAELDRLDASLRDRRFLGDATPSDEDWRLYVVLVRFDAVYYGLYKLNRTRLCDFPNLGGWLRDLYDRDAAGVDLRAVAKEAYGRRLDLNPKGIAPRDVPDMLAPHDRWRFDGTSAVGGTADGTRTGVVGEFVRGRSGFRERIERGEAGRYHLYIANNCPWCHRVALARSMKGLQGDISLGVLYYRRNAERGWQFRPDQPGFDADTVNGVTFIKELYERFDSKEGSVPVLWDKVEQRIVSNESAEIVRMMDDAWLDRGPRLAPPELRPEIDHHNAWVYRDINNGAYRAGFANSEAAYAQAFEGFFAALDRLERIFAERQFLCGSRVTEADLRLFPTLFRFDPVYYVRFRLNRRMLKEYRNTSRWLADMGALPGVQEASNLEHCKRGYFGRNGNNIVPLGDDKP